MSALVKDSFDVPAIGKQFDSKKESMPVFSFGTSNRERHQQKIFLSDKHEKHKGKMNSPGPVYSMPSTMGAGPHFGFGTSVRPHDKAAYPDSSVDLTCAEVDSQGVKFHSSKSIHFGTESRENPKNAELLRTHPQGGLGVGVPGSGEYSPNEKHTTQRSPRFGMGTEKKLPETATSQTPRHVGPGTYPTRQAIGQQACSANRSAPSWKFGGSPRSPKLEQSNALLDPSPNLSSLGQQVVSSARTAPHYGFGTATRHHAAKTHLVQTSEDKGPSARMPPIRVPMPAV